MRHTGRCPEVITAASVWQLGHIRPVRRGGDGSDAVPWCTACNAADGARATNARIRPHVSRSWG